MRSIATVIINPGCNFSEHTVASISISLSEIATTNCDALIDRSGTIKTVSWSKETGGFSTPTAQGGIYVEDFAGHSTTISLPSGAKEPDVVLATTYMPSISAYGYQVAFVYSDLSGNCTLEVWDLNDVGLPSFYASPSVFYSSPIPLSSSCNGMPHIDMWSDAANTWNGYPTMHQFAIVWQDASGHLTYLVSDISTISGITGGSPLPTPAGSPSSTITGYAPDVACLTDVVSGDQELEIVYGDGVNGPANSAAAATLTVAEYNLTSLATSLTSLTAPGTTIFTPRIEAMSQYYSGATTVPAKWNVAVNIGVDVYAYNDKIGISGINISGPLGALCNALGPCVSAGTGASTPSGQVGNDFYHVGFYPWCGSDAYDVELKTANGALAYVIPTYNFWTINCNAITYNYDRFMALAVSTCSNSGDYKFASWYNGTDFVYVETTNVQPYIKAPGNAGGGTESPVSATGYAAALETGSSPSASANLGIPGSVAPTGREPKAYYITDLMGRIIAKGEGGLPNTTSNALAQGIYILHTATASGAEQVTRFYKP